MRPIIETAKLFIAASLLGLMSCEYSESTKPEYVGISSANKEMIARFELELKKANIPYKANDLPDGKRKLRWDRKYSEAARQIEIIVMGFIPPGHNSFCFDEKSNPNLEEFTNTLQKNDITYDITNPYDGKPCVYWSVEEDIKVRDASPTYKMIKEACEKDPRCKM